MQPSLMLKMVFTFISCNEERLVHRPVQQIIEVPVPQIVEEELWDSSMLSTLFLDIANRSHGLNILQSNYCCSFFWLEIRKMVMNVFSIDPKRIYPWPFISLTNLVAKKF